MRRARTIECASCHARWNARTARFCGWCGVPLRPPPAPAPEDDAPRRPNRFVVAGLGILAVVAATVATRGLTDLQLPRERPDPRVDLAEPDTAVAPQGDPLSDDERAALLAPFDPDRLRCEPTGCERWRADFAADDDRGFEVVPFGDLVVALADDTFRAFDVDTGQERWQTGWPATEGPHLSRPWSTALPAGDAQRLIVAQPPNGAMLALDRSGEMIWHTQMPGPWQNFSMAGEVVIADSGGGQHAVAAEAPAAEEGEETGQVEETYPVGHLHAIDVTTGDRLWERPQMRLMAATETAVVAREGPDMVLLDPRDGTERARRALPADRWVNFVGTGVVAVAGESGVQQLFSTADLRLMAEFDEPAEIRDVAESDLTVARVPGQPRGHGADVQENRGEGDRVSLLQADGQVRWTVEADAPPGTVRLCCPSPHLEDEALVLPPPVTGDEQLWFALDDGRRLPARQPQGARHPPDDNVWQMGPDTALLRRGDRAILAHEGEEVTIHGNGWPVTMEAPFVFSNGRSLLGIDPVPSG